MSRPTLMQLSGAITQMQALVDQVVSKAETAGLTEEIRGTFQGTARMFSAAVTSWTNKQADEVIAGSRSEASWRAYGLSLEAQAKDYLKYMDEQSGWFTRILGWISGGVLAGLDSIAAKVAQLRRDLNAVGKSRAAVMTARATLASRAQRLSQESYDALYGPPFDAADATWNRLVDIVSGLESAVALVRGGRAGLAPADNGDVALVPLSGVAEQLLGALPVLAAGTVLATVAIAAALIVAVRSYYQHADEVSRAETAKIELDLVAQGKGADVTKLRELRTQADEARDGAPLGETIAKYAAGAVVTVGLGWGALKLLERWIGGRS